MTLAIMGLAIALLLFLRVPVGFAILGPCLGYLWLTDQSLGLSMRLAAQGVNSWPLLAIPLFVLVGVTANRAGIADRLFDFDDHPHRFDVIDGGKAGKAPKAKKAKRPRKQGTFMQRMEQRWQHRRDQGY